MRRATGPQCAQLTIKQPELSAEPTGALHCLSCVTALKGEHATLCGEPDCSGVIDQLPGVIPRYRAAETNAGKNTLNLLSPAGSRRQGESSPFPQAKAVSAGRECSCFLLLPASPNTCFELGLSPWMQIVRNEYQGRLQRRSNLRQRPERIKITAHTNTAD